MGATLIILVVALTTVIVVALYAIAEAE